ncbi:MAG TPA: DMT family transporter [Acidimicrobiales bacterium]|nr:DMT family transporter [Acidimicrobiales bacterium]
MSPRSPSHRRPLLLAAAGAACISSSAVLVQLADVGAVTTAFFRCVLALPALCGVAVIEQRRHGRRSVAQRAKAAAAGIAFAVDLVLWNHAIADVGAGVATVLGNLQVLFVAVAAWAVFHERPSGRFLAALPVVAIGVVLAAGAVGGSSYGRHPVAGILYGVGTSIAYAVFLLVLRTVSGSSPHVAGPLSDATAGAAVSALAIGLVAGTLQFAPAWPALGWLLALAILSQTLGWLLITSPLPRLPAAVSSLMLLLQPAVAVLLAAVVLSQHPGLWQLTGAALVCTGVLLAASRSVAPTAELTVHSLGEPNAAT